MRSEICPDSGIVTNDTQAATNIPNPIVDLQALGSQTPFKVVVEGQKGGAGGAAGAIGSVASAVGGFL